MSTQLMTVMQQRRGLSGLADDYSGGDYGGDYGGFSDFSSPFDYGGGSDYSGGSDPSFDPNGGMFGGSDYSGGSNSGSDYYLYNDQNGFLVDSNGNEVDQDGNLVNSQGEYVDQNGDYVSGNPVHVAPPDYSDSSSGGGGNTRGGSSGGGSGGGGSFGGGSSGGGGGAPKGSGQQPQDPSKILDAVARLAGSLTGHQQQVFPNTAPRTVTATIDPRTGLPIANVGAGLGGAAGGFVDNIFKTVSRNPVPFLIGGVALALYKMQPSGGSYRK